MVKIRRCQGLEKFERHAVAVHNPSMFFNEWRFKNDSFVSERYSSMSKKLSLYYCFRNYPLGKVDIANRGITERGRQGSIS